MTRTEPQTKVTHSLYALLGSAGVSDMRLTGVTSDSRRVGPGMLFVALPGTKGDGRDFIADAAARGAAAILSTPCAREKAGRIPFICDPNPRRRYSEIAARFFEERQPEIQVAVTGTNGKTSVADFARQMWENCGYSAASIGTLGVRSPDFTAPGGLTTPDPMLLMQQVAELAKKGVTHTAFEASSHGLDQHRLDGLDFKAAAYTNLSRDHLDYHGSFENYFYAKARLFGEVLKPGKIAVINTDDAKGKLLLDLAWGRGLETISVGRGLGASLRLDSARLNSDGQELELELFGSFKKIYMPLMGGFQADNMLVALGLVYATGGDMDLALERVGRLQGVPGRMQNLGRTPAGGQVILDYAHTPAGLETVLRSARAHNPSEVRLVFGCGGDRDKGKRPQMGKIAATFADYIYVTDDNPRSENPADIRSDILKGCRAGTSGKGLSGGVGDTCTAVDIGDRKKAIEMALCDLKDRGMLILAGKGHEEGQIIGNETLPFSDLKTVESLLGKSVADSKGDNR